jgi:hypothetical protein
MKPYLPSSFDLSTKSRSDASYWKFQADARALFCLLYDVLCEESQTNSLLTATE